MKKAYIFKNGRYWYIDHFDNLQDAEKNTRPGWTVALYVSTSQIWGCF